jgi:SAM-dependent methyltransferase
MKQKLKKHQEIISGKVLDIGCGNKPYKNIFKNIKKYIGTNSEAYYKNSLQKINEHDIIVEDGTELPVADKSYDAVLNFQVLPVFENPNDFYKEVYRVLKPEGYFLLTTDFLYPIWNAPYNFWRTTKFGLQKLAEWNHFKIIYIESFGGYWVMQARLLERYFRSLLPKLLKSISVEKNIILKALKFLRVLFWLIIVLISPILLNIIFLVFHFLDKIFYDDEFTTNYFVLMQKEK